jgi:hypothetical protein
MTVIKNTNLGATPDLMFRPPNLQQTLASLRLHGPGGKDLPPRGLENPHQTTRRKIPVKTAQLAKSHARACPYLALLKIAL